MIKLIPEKFDPLVTCNPMVIDIDIVLKILDKGDEKLNGNEQSDAKQCQYR